MIGNPTQDYKLSIWSKPQLFLFKKWLARHLDVYPHFLLLFYSGQCSNKELVVWDIYIGYNRCSIIYSWSILEIARFPSRLPLCAFRTNSIETNLIIKLFSPMLMRSMARQCIHASSCSVTALIQLIMWDILSLSNASWDVYVLIYTLHC